MGYGFTDNSFLNFGELYKRNLNAHISARYHNSVGELDNPVDIVISALVFDFRYDIHALEADTVYIISEGAYVVSRAHEARRYDFRAVFKSELYIGTVLRADERHRNMIIRNVNALSVRELTAFYNFAFNSFFRNLGNGHNDFTVVEQHCTSDSFFVFV